MRPETRYFSNLPETELTIACNYVSVKRKNRFILTYKSLSIEIIEIEVVSNLIVRPNWLKTQHLNARNQPSTAIWKL